MYMLLDFAYEDELWPNRTFLFPISFCDAQNPVIDNFLRENHYHGSAMLGNVSLRLTHIHTYHAQVV